MKNKSKEEENINDVRIGVFRTRHDPLRNNPEICTSKFKAVI